jgi:steroid delta-isomerase-like uncharacterized protein
MPTQHLTIEATNSLITDLLAAWNTHDIDRAVTFYAPDYEGIDVNEAGPHFGPTGARQYISRYLQAFPDLIITAEPPIIQGDRLALVWLAEGTHQGRLMNIPATGHPVQVRGVSLLTVAAGQVVRGTYIWDVAGLLRSIGLLPEL